MSARQSSPFLDAALKYARLGFYVLPVKAGRKAPPQTEHGVKDATRDEETICARWRRSPDANVAIATGLSGIAVLDADKRNGAAESLPKIGELFREEGLGPTYAVSVTPGGWQLFFLAPSDSTLIEALGNGCTGLFPGIDILAGERYSVAPPSTRSDGGYRWSRPIESIAALPEFPTALIQMVGEHRRNGSSSQTRRRAPRSGDRTTIPLGERNHAAFETACTLLRQRLSEQAVIEELCAMRDRGRFENPVDDSLSDDEIRKLVASAASAVWKRAATNETNHKWQDSRPWPTLDAAALYGLAGELVRSIELETEADPAALLATLLVGFGNAIGPLAHATVQGDSHPARLFAAVVGSTSTGGKGMSLATIKPFLRAADAEWFDECQKSGFGSGEAIITELSGAHRLKDDKHPIEHRAFVVEPEFARLLTINARDGSTLSPILRSAWDDGRLELRHSKARMVATDAHVSILAHITPDELREKLRSIEVASGFANRVLFLLARRVRKLPSGGNITPAVVRDFGCRLNQAIQYARGVGAMRRTAEAEAVWAQFYMDEPDREGIVGAICDRAQAQKLRLSVVYALLDRSATIHPQHVIAAESFWRYCVASAERIWGSATGDNIADRLLEKLREVYPDGVSRDDARRLFAGHIESDRLTVAIDYLCRRGLARIEKQPTEGRSREVLYALPCA